MNREEVLEQLYQVKELIEFLDKKEELLRTMKFIALEVLNAEIREEWFWINRFKIYKTNLAISNRRFQVVFQKFLIIQ